MGSARQSQEKEWGTGHAVWKETQALAVTDSVFAFEEYLQTGDLKAQAAMRPKAVVTSCFMATVSSLPSSKITATLAGAKPSELVSFCKVSCFDSYTDANVSTMLALRSYQRVNHSGRLCVTHGRLSRGYWSKCYRAAFSFFSDCGKTRI